MSLHRGDVDTAMAQVHYDAQQRWASPQPQTQPQCNSPWHRRRSAECRTLLMAPLTVFGCQQWVQLQTFCFIHAMERRVRIQGLSSLLRNRPVCVVVFGLEWFLWFCNNKRCSHLTTHGTRCCSCHYRGTVVTYVRFATNTLIRHFR